MGSNYQQIIDQQKKSLKAYVSMCLLLVALVGVYSYFQLDKYTRYNEAIASNDAFVTVLKDSRSTEESVYDSEKPKFKKLQTDMEETLKEVFPISDNYTELTRAFDTFEQSLHRATNPFVISSIDYQDVKTSANGQYKYLPLRMNISSSKENFMKFLEYIETSGSLVGKVRLMDIQSIRLNFSEDAGTDVKTINFSVLIHAYFQNI